MGDWQPIETIPITPDPPPGKTWPEGAEYLLWGEKIGRRIGECWNWRGSVRANVANLHGCAIADWGATKWMRLPDEPSP